MSDPTKAAAARRLLDQQKDRLERAISLIEADGGDRWSLEQARRMLRRVESWRRDRDDFVTLALGFMGRNGWGPLLDMICDEAEKLAAAERPIQLVEDGDAPHPPAASRRAPPSPQMGEGTTRAQAGGR
jgi:hypothetical protein